MHPAWVTKAHDRHDNAQFDNQLKNKTLRLCKYMVICDGLLL